MKIHLNIRPILTVFVSVLIFSTFSQNAYSQNSEKNKVRLSASYFKTMDQEAFIDIKATSKINRKTVGISNIELSINYKLNDEEISLGIATTNMDGKSKFVLKNMNNLKPDSTGTYTISIFFKGNDLFKKSSKNISFKDVNITSQIITKDSINYITATLVNTFSKEPVIGESLEIKIARLFKPLNIGKPYYKTDELGEILVPIENGIPGVEGYLTIQVVLNDSDDYGTVTDLTKAKIGIPIVEESTFDKRTMWSPRNKTPLFLLILPNIFIIAIWGIIFYLISNLFKLYKSSKNKII